MKKQIISLIAMIGLITAPALAGVWTAQPTGGSTSCYLVKFNANYGYQQLMGNGVVSGNTFSGFLRGTPNSQTNGNTYLITCGSSGACAWIYAGNGDGNLYFHVVSVTGLPIVSATPIACY